MALTPIPSEFNQQAFLKSYFERKSTVPQRIYAKGWDEARIQKARERCLQHQPWRFSTGARTQQGKRKVSMNALRHSKRSRIMRDITALIEQISQM